MLMQRCFLIFFLWGITLPIWAADLWVDATQGDDTQDGLTPATALRTLQAAANIATAGTIVHIQPGIYRETVKPAHSGTADAPIVYQAEQGAGSVILRGSIPLVDPQPLTDNHLGLPATVDMQQIVWFDLSAEAFTQTPRFVMQLQSDDTPVMRLTVARAPDWSVETAWKQHEFWWVAEGGSEVAACDPTVDRPRQTCDQATRSLTQLTDRHDDAAPIAPGNLTTLGDLTGATLIAVDTVQGNYIFRRTIIAHEVTAGRITLDRPASYGDEDTPGLGWGSKYYLENHPVLLDTPGEYWFDTTTQRLYVWPLATTGTWEVSQRDIGWDLSDRSYLILDGLTFEYFNGTVISGENTATQGSHGNVLRHVQLRYANQGIVLTQQQTTTTLPEQVTQGFKLEQAEIAYMDTAAVYSKGAWENNSDNTLFQQAPITGTVIRQTTFHHLGFRAESDSVSGLYFNFPDHLRLEDNHIHHVAQNGILLANSVIQSDKTYDFAPEAIKTGDILIKNNLVEKTCQMIGTCAGTRLMGTPPHNHVFRNTLIIGNTFRENYGWSDVSAQRGRWQYGLFGFGLHLISTGGVHVHRNLVYNNGRANLFVARNWRDGRTILSNNLFANALVGLDMWNPEGPDTHDSVDTQVINNLFINNELHGISHTAAPEDVRFIIDHNLYYANGWGDGRNVGEMNVSYQNFYFLFMDIQANTPWEANGTSADPAFFSYDYHGQRQRNPYNVLDFDLRSHSAAIDQGTVTLPTSLLTLMQHFGVEEMTQQGIIWDIGALEYVPEHQPTIELGMAKETITEQIQTTQAEFEGLITTGFTTTTVGPRGHDLTLYATEQVKIFADIWVDPQDVGQQGEVAIVAAYLPLGSQDVVYFMRKGITWVPWDRKLVSLLATELDANLPEQITLPARVALDIYEGDFQGALGDFTIYVGYHLIEKGVVIFNGQQPIRLTIR